MMVEAVVDISFHLRTNLACEVRSLSLIYHVGAQLMTALVGKLILYILFQIVLIKQCAVSVLLL